MSRRRSELEPVDRTRLGGAWKTYVKCSEDAERASASLRATVRIMAGKYPVAAIARELHLTHRAVAKMLDDTAP